MWKKSLRIFGLVIFLMFLGAINVSAGKWKTWNWKSYRLQFKLPANFQITQSFSTRMVANDGKSLSVLIRAWKSVRISAKKVAKTGFREYTALSSKKIIKQGSIKSSDNVYNGHIIVGTGFSNRRKVNFAIFGFVRPKSVTKFYFKFSWWDNSQYNSYYTNLVQEIINTVTWMDYSRKGGSLNPFRRRNAFGRKKSRW